MIKGISRIQFKKDCYWANQLNSNLKTLQLFSSPKYNPPPNTSFWRTLPFIIFKSHPSSNYLFLLPFPFIIYFSPSSLYPLIINNLVFHCRDAPKEGGKYLQCLSMLIDRWVGNYRYPTEIKSNIFVFPVG